MNKIIITGSNGFIGKHVSKYFKKKYKIIELSSSKKTKKNLKWEMGKKLPIKNLNNTFFFHFAFDSNLNEKSNELKNNINFTETVNLSNEIEQKKNSKFFYISSQTSNKNAKSSYGKIKYLIEKKISKNICTKIIIPGLVYHKNNSKVVSTLKTLAKLKFFIIFDNKKNIYPIHIEDFCLFLEKILLDNKRKKYYLGSKKPISLKQLVNFICKDNNISKPIFLYLPKSIIYFFSNIIDMMNIFKTSITERIDSLTKLNKINTNKTIKDFRFKFKYNF